MMATELQPLSVPGHALSEFKIRHGRRVEIDIIRGGALFGVLLANLQSLTYTGIYLPLLTFANHTTFNRATEAFIRSFAEGSFYSLFATLFGLGFAIAIAHGVVMLTQPTMSAWLSALDTTLRSAALGLSYAAGLLLLLQSPSWQQRLKPLSFVGRASLSNYLLQSIIFTSLYYGYGGGLYARVPPSANVLLALVLYALHLSGFRKSLVALALRQGTYGSVVASSNLQQNACFVARAQAFITKASHERHKKSSLVSDTSVSPQHV